MDWAACSRVIEVLIVVVKPALSCTWQYTAFVPEPPVSSQFLLVEYDSHVDWINEASLLNRNCELRVVTYSFGAYYRVS